MPDSSVSPDSIRRTLDSADGAVAVSSPPGTEMTIPGRVEKIRAADDLGSCNPPWSSWDS